MVDRMVVNAAIEKLIAGEEEGWLDSAWIVVEFGLKVPSSSWEVLIHTHHVGEDVQTGSSIGFAAGQGNVSVEDRRKGGSTESNYYGTTVERIGYYKLIHHAKEKALRIWHYRSDTSWQNLRDQPIPVQYMLFYTDKYQPHTFAELAFEEVATPLWQRLIALTESVRFRTKLFLQSGKWAPSQRISRNYRHRAYTVILSIELPQGSVVS